MADSNIDIKVGDMVRLKTGGPLMTAGHVGGQVKVFYFERLSDGKGWGPLITEHIDVEALEVFGLIAAAGVAETE